MKIIKLEYNGKILYQLRKTGFTIANKEPSKIFIIGLRKFNKIKNNEILAHTRYLQALDNEYKTGRSRKQYSFYMNESQFNQYKQALEKYKKLNYKTKCNEIDLFLLLGLQQIKTIEKIEIN